MSIDLKTLIQKLETYLYLQQEIKTTVDDLINKAPISNNIPNLITINYKGQSIGNISICDKTFEVNSGLDRRYKVVEDYNTMSDIELIFSIKNSLNNFTKLDDIVSSLKAGNSIEKKLHIWKEGGDYVGFITFNKETGNTKSYFDKEHELDDLCINELMSTCEEGSL